MRREGWMERGPRSKGQKQTQSKVTGARAGLGTHLLSNQIVEQGNHAYGQHLCALLLYQAPQNLQPPQLQELLLGIGEVSQQGAQCKQDLGRHRPRRVRGEGPHRACPAPRPTKGSERCANYPSPAPILPGTTHYPQVQLHPRTQVWESQETHETL